MEVHDAVWVRENLFFPYLRDLPYFSTSLILDNLDAYFCAREDGVEMVSCLFHERISFESRFNYGDE